MIWLFMSSWFWQVSERTRTPLEKNRQEEEHMLFSLKERHLFVNIYFVKTNTGNRYKLYCKNFKTFTQKHIRHHLIWNIDLQCPYNAFCKFTKLYSDLKMHVKTVKKIKNSIREYWWCFHEASHGFYIIINIFPISFRCWILFSKKDWRRRTLLLIWDVQWRRTM